MELKKFFQSFKFKAIHWKVFALDSCFYISIFLAFALYAFSFSRWSDVLGGLNLANPADLSPFEIESARNLLAGFWSNLIIYTSLLALFALISYSFFKGMIWRLILKKRFSLDFFLKFLLLNLCWCIALTFITVLISFFTVSITSIELSPLMPALAYMSLAAKHPYLTAVLTLLMLHTTAMLQIYFAQEPNFSAVKKAFSSFKKFHVFLFNYLFALIPLIAVFLISFLVSYLPTALETIISVAAIIMFTTWLRFYIADITKSLR